MHATARWGGKRRNLIRSEAQQLLEPDGIWTASISLLVSSVSHADRRRTRKSNLMLSQAPPPPLLHLLKSSSPPSPPKKRCGNWSSFNWMREDLGKSEGGGCWNQTTVYWGKLKGESKVLGKRSPGEKTWCLVTNTSRLIVTASDSVLLLLLCCFCLILFPTRSQLIRQSIE